MDKIYLKRYSAAFKQSVVREYERGASITSLRKRYGIGGAATIQNWIRQYGVIGFRHEVIVMQRAEEQQREKELEARIGQLEQALAQITVDKLLLESLLEVASERYGEDVETLKKKRGRPPLSEREKKRGRSNKG